MIYVFENPNNYASVVYDGDTLTDYEKSKGIAIEELPYKTDFVDKTAILKCKKATGDVWWEYVVANATNADLQLQGEINHNTLALLEVDFRIMLIENNATDLAPIYT